MCAKTMHAISINPPQPPHPTPPTNHRVENVHGYTDGFQADSINMILLCIYIPDMYVYISCTVDILHRIFTDFMLWILFTNVWYVTSLFNMIHAICHWYRQIFVVSMWYFQPPGIQIVGWMLFEDSRHCILFLFQRHNGDPVWRWWLIWMQDHNLLKHVSMVDGCSLQCSASLKREKSYNKYSTIRQSMAILPINMRGFVGRFICPTRIRFHFPQGWHLYRGDAWLLLNDLREVADKDLVVAVEMISSLWLIARVQWLSFTII